MAQLGNFDATQVDPSKPRDYTPIPAGKYLMQIVVSEMRSTKDGSGSYLSLEHEVLDGEHKGRRLWNNLNLHNPSAETVEIAQRELSAICHAIGKLHITDSEELHFVPMVVTVRVKPAGPDRKGIQREAQNEIKGYEPAVGAAPAVPSRLRPVPEQPLGPPQRDGTLPQQTGKLPPWRNKKAG